MSVSEHTEEETTKDTVKVYYGLFVCITSNILFINHVS